MGLGPGIYRSGFRFSAGTASSSATNTGLKPSGASAGSGTWSASGNATSNAASGTSGGAFALRYCTTRNMSAPVTNGSVPISVGTAVGSSTTTAMTASTTSSLSAPVITSVSTTVAGQSVKVTTCTPIHWTQPVPSRVEQQNRRTNIMATASCLRVLNVVRHWITKFPGVSTGLSIMGIL